MTLHDLAAMLILMALSLGSILVLLLINEKEEREE